MTALIDKLPKELRTNYQKSRKNSPTIETLKIAAALKLWNDRGFEDIQFDVPMTIAGKHFFVKVLAKHSIGTVFGVECVSNVRLSWLRVRLLTLQLCLPHESYIVAVLPHFAENKFKKILLFADEIWAVDISGTIEQVFFSHF